MDSLALMPKYEAYKDSGIKWLGDIPKHWNLKSLKRVVKEHSGNGFPIELQGLTGDVPFLKVSDLSCTEILVDRSANRVSHKVIKKQKWNIVPAGSLVTAKIGEALRKNHRKLLAYDSIIDNNCIAFECKEIEKRYNFYLHLVLDFDWFVNPGAVPSISVSKYKSQKVAVPLIEEQTLIANFLDKKTAQVDKAIAIKEQQISLLKERKQIIIQQAVTQGLDPNVPMKDSGVDWIVSIPAHWEVTRAKYIFDEIDERSKTGDEELMSVSHMTGVTPRSEKNVSMFMAEDYTGSKLCRENDLVINIMWAWMGALGVSDRVGIVSPSYGVFRQKVKNTFNPNYLEYLLKSVNYVEYYNKVSTGLHSSRLRFYGHMLFAMKMGYPSYKEQNEIMAYLHEQTKRIDLALDSQLAQIEKLKEYKTTLINSAVTGKIKITQEMIEQ